ncbi:MAG: hypothetical protein JSV44_12755 [Candidatus Zixiibacteriota bacterium]|nr:MAG: hypothetical protein JSV44_12755 [candidate division Zixibacteria bacterium]
MAEQFALEPLVLTRNKRRAAYIVFNMNRLFETGQGISIGKIAQHACSTANAVITDITDLWENRDAVDSLWVESVRGFLDQAEKNAVRSEEFEKHFRFITLVEDSEDGAEIPAGKRVDYMEETYPRRIYGIAIARAMGAQFDKWLVKTPQVLLRGEKNPTEWKVCRAGNAVAEQQNEKVEKYKKAVRAVNPHLQKLESLIATYDQKVEQWMKAPDGGEPALKAMGILNMVDNITDVYSLQDKSVESVNGMVRAMEDLAGNQLKRQLADNMRDTLADMRAFATDRDFNEAMLEYLFVWDPSDHYYWHTDVANSVAGAAKSEKVKSGSKYRKIPLRFDDRVFKAVTQLAEYLSSDDQASVSAADEANRTFAEIYKEVIKLEKSGKLVAVKLDFLIEQGRAKFKQLNESGETSVITTFAVWTGYIMGTCVGNFEGPPSVLSLFLTAYSKSESFINAVGQNTLRRAILMIGVDPLERKTIDMLIKRGDPDSIKTARDLFVNGSWRSNRIFAVYSLWGIATLVYHSYKAIDMATDEEVQIDNFIKQWLVITSDVANLGLVYMTVRYSAQMNTFLAENAGVSTEALAAKISELETADLYTPAGRRVVMVKMFHRVMAGIGLVLSVWDLADNWGRSDGVEKSLLAVTVVGSLMSLVGTFVSLSWLGPVGFVITLLCGIAMLVYSWFQKGIKKTLRQLLTAFEDSEYYENIKHMSLDQGWTIQWIFWFPMPRLKNYSDLFDQLYESVLDVSWKDPDEKYIIHYLRAGLNMESLAMVYDKDMDDWEDKSWLIVRVRNQRVRAARAAKKRPRKFKVDMTKPVPGVKLYLGELTPVEIIVYNIEYLEAIYLDTYNHDCWKDNPGEYLLQDTWENEIKAGNTYNAVIRMVELKRTKKKRDHQIYQGGIRIAKMPEGGKAVFHIRVPNIAQIRQAFPVGSL